MNRYWTRMLIAGAVAGLLAAGLTGCKSASEEALQHPTFKTPPREPRGPVGGSPAPPTLSGPNTSGPGGTPGNTHF